MPISVTVNDAPHTLPESATVAALLEALGLDRRKIAVERNAAVVPRSTYDQASLADGDRLEIVHFIGGG